jgi:hypothetical protein
MITSLGSLLARSVLMYYYFGDISLLLLLLALFLIGEADVYSPLLKLFANAD